MSSHLELVFQDEDDEFKRGSDSERHLVQDLLAAPALPLQRVADDARLLQSGVEVKRHVCPRLHAAAAGKIYLEPGGRRRGDEL